jgi:hypothetical protein
MPSSPARILANQANAQRSTGPKTLEGKAASRQNGFKHGLSGQGIVLPEEDADEVERRHQALQAELAPKSAMGQILVLQLATLSVKMERAAKQESAALASRVRHASEAFDDERFEQAEQLFATLADDPRRVLRKLRKSPEGVDRLLEAWGDLRRDLTRESRPCWAMEDLKLAGALLGLRPIDVAGSRLEALARANWGDVHGLADSEKFGPDQAQAGKAWARARLLERVDQAIAELQAHRASLDFDTIAKDRAEAGDRALFDPSREATLARRYESEARRAFFKSLKEFREAEAAEIESTTTEIPDELAESLGSSRENGMASIREPQPSAIIDPRIARNDRKVARDSQNRSKAVAQTLVGAV